jgi:hypothetical protein
MGILKHWVGVEGIGFIVLGIYTTFCVHLSFEAICQTNEQKFIPT